MKKLVSLILLLACILPSCNNTVTDEDIAANLEGYETLFDEASVGTSPETKYAATSLTGVEGIISPDYTINDNKYYFITKRRDQRGYNGLSMLAYVDLKTGDNHIICPDPLCDHEDYYKCKYVEFEKTVFTEENGVFYSIRATSFTPSICKIDLNNDTVTTIHIGKSLSTRFIGIDGGKLYFHELEQTTKDKQTSRACHMYAIDISNDTVEDLGYTSDQFATELGTFRLVYNGEFYYTTNQGKFMKCDLNFENQTEICTLWGESLYYYFYDTKTDELYFNTVNNERKTGSIYIYKDGVTEKVELPHEDIFTFTLTNSKIYYSTYNPVYFGVSNAPSHPPVYDYSGGKIYAVDRNDPTEAEVVYDCAGEYVVSDGVTNYTVLGDYLYFQEDEVIREVDDAGNEYVYFSSAQHVNRIRVNLTTGEMTRIQFE